MSLVEIITENVVKVPLASNNKAEVITEMVQILGRQQSFQSEGKL